MSTYAMLFWSEELLRRWICNKKHPTKITKSTDMKHWSMRDKEERKQFEYGWTSGKHIKGDYYTKHFCSAHHKQVRQDYLTARSTLDALRTRLGQPCHVYNVNERVCQISAYQLLAATRLELGRARGQSVNPKHRHMRASRVSGTDTKLATKIHTQDNGHQRQDRDIQRH